MSPTGNVVHNATLSSAVTVAVPDGADWIMISAQTNSVRVTLNGETPTDALGILVTTVTPVVLPVLDGGSVKFIEQTASAAVDYYFFRD
jgi:hypothetical protein